jgi:hypothetical protein
MLAQICWKNIATEPWKLQLVAVGLCLTYVVQSACYIEKSGLLMNKSYFISPDSEEVFQILFLHLSNTWIF